MSAALQCISHMIVATRSRLRPELWIILRTFVRRTTMGLKVG
jgi:hypothetical protein